MKKKMPMPVLDIVPRIAARHERERQQFDAEFRAITSQIPFKVLRVLIDAVVPRAQRR